MTPSFIRYAKTSLNHIVTFANNKVGYAGPILAPVPKSHIWRNTCAGSESCTVLFFKNISLIEAPNLTIGPLARDFARKTSMLLVSLPRRLTMSPCLICNHGATLLGERRQDKKESTEQVNATTTDSTWEK